VLDLVLSPEGWVYASAAPVDERDPGRFHALFGRDSLITALQLMPEREEIARATLRALAALQGRRDDPETDEEPGKIVHEYWPQAPARFSEHDWPVRAGTLRYYGSADSTSWFLVLLAALGDHDLAHELESGWRTAGGWLERALEQGGGFIRHGPRRAPGGLAQQGWRDTIDPLDPACQGGGIVREDGSAPTPPLADADSQAVALAALRALSRLSASREEQVRWTTVGDALAVRIETCFDPETMALEAGCRTVRGAGSQLGWLLWAGALSGSAADAAADRLTRADVLTDFGLRTLAESHPQFSRDAYHRGSVWPFDSWIGWGGLRAAGHDDEAERVRAGVLTGIERLGGAPELYAVGPDGPEPVAISNRVQAWTIGARRALERDWDGRLS
jgi:glycogen debranching enzyme